MKVWKSPVFYFGILLVVAVVGLLAAPFVIDWNNYRADLQDYGRKLTGRKVTIGGPISARLFPWPMLVAQKVEIANPPALSDKPFATADRIVVRVSLAGLIRGGIDVESVDIEAAEVGLERLATGEGNWQFQPSADLLRSDILSRVKLDQIRFTDSAVSFSDRRRGETLTLDAFAGSVASPGVAGPWRLTSEGVYNDQVYSIGLATGVWRDGEPFRLGFRVAPRDNTGFAWSFDGAATAASLEGTARVEPATAAEGKGDAEGRLKPFAVSAKVKADFDRIAFDGIDITRVTEDQTGGPIASGSAVLTLGHHIGITANLEANVLDLDELIGAKSREALRQRGNFALADDTLAQIPPEVSLAGSLKVSALKAAGETFDNLSLIFSADRSKLSIKDFQTGLPGRSDIKFGGLYTPGGPNAHLEGLFTAGTPDLRALTFWLWPGVQEKLAPLWTGSRGRFKFESDVDIRPDRANFPKAAYSLDGEEGTIDLSIASGGRGSVALRITSNRIDVENLMPQGVSVPALASGEAGALAALVLPRENAPDLRLALDTPELLLNGVTAGDVSLDLQSGENGLVLKTLAIGSVGGARLDASGVILDQGQGPDGAINLTVKAEDPRELLRLAGFIPRDGQPAWAEGLGPTALAATLTTKPGGKGADLGFEANGTAGELTLDATGSLTPDGTMTGKASVAAPHSGRLLALAGYESAADGNPGSLRIEASGNAAQGFMADVTAQLYDVRFDYRGAANPAAEGYGLDGTLSLRATDANPLLTALGVPLQSVPHGVLAADGSLAFKGGKWSMPDLDGQLDTARFSGSIELDPQLHLNGRLSTGELALTDVAAAVFTQWGGAGPSLDSSFAERLPLGITGEIWLTPKALRVNDQESATHAEIGILADAEGISLALADKEPSGRNIQIELSSKGQGAVRTLSGTVVLPVDLAQQLKLANGGSIADGQGTLEVRFDGEGRSPGGALAGLRGTGSYAFEGLTLAGLSPQGFSAKLAEAKDAAGIRAAFDALKAGAGLELGNVAGTITITGGEVTFQPFGLNTSDADVQVKTLAELGSGEIDAEVTLSLKARPGLPAMSVSYAGPPAALVRNEDTAELGTKLGVTIMQEGIDELERLQQEQQRLAEQEAQQKVEDEARLETYYAQRDELLLRKRELRVHAEMRAVEADRLRAKLESERAANADLNKAEMKQRTRELRFYRRLTKPNQAQKQKAQAPPPAPPPPKLPVAPVILVQPEGAPAIISPKPDASPTQ